MVSFYVLSHPGLAFTSPLFTAEPEDVFFFIFSVILAGQGVFLHILHGLSVPAALSHLYPL